MQDEEGSLKEEFLRCFFISEDSYKFFRSAFVPPLDYPDIVESILPDVSGALKVVILDGHPRTGKTWVAAEAAGSVVQQLGLQRHQWWTAGKDSLRECSPRDDLPTAVNKVLTAIRGKGFRLVLLDDFLGANSPRETRGDPDILRFFTWNNENPWLQEVADDCVFILVERAMFFKLDEIRLGSTIRAEAGRSGRRTIEVIRRRHGVFRSGRSGKVIGAFDDDTLAKILRTHLAHHPLRGFGGTVTESMLSNAPLVAFGMQQATKDEATRNEQTLGIDEKKTVSWSLFGGDLVTLSDWIQTRENSNEPRVQLERMQLDLAYLIMIAPALVFLETAAYEALGLDRKQAELCRDELYMVFDGGTPPDAKVKAEHVGDTVSARVPNEFYVLAVREHLRGQLEAVARVAWRIVGSSGSKQRHRAIGLIVRGILERLLESGDAYDREGLFRELAWQRLVGELKSSESGADALLYLERAEADSDIKMLGQDLSPGLAAAMGWLLYRFPDFAAARGDAIQSVFATGLLKQRASNEPANEMLASFSPLLQWAIRKWREQNAGADLLERTASLLPDTIEAGLIVEDELIWGLFYDAETIPEAPSEPFVERILSFLGHNAGTVANDLAVKSQLANRVFSLAWHNEWKPIADGAEKGDSGNAQRVRRYFDAAVAAAKGLIRAEPALLDANLRYHWTHLVTQHAVWMRQWCFELDPNEYERRRAAPGSRAIADNDDLVDLFLALLTPGASGERVRNCLFLAGTRAQRLSCLRSILTAIDDLMRREGDSDREIEIGILQAVFELMRQGYYNRPEELSEPEERQIQDATWKDWEQWSRNAFTRLARSRPEAWKRYYRELERLSHRYDMLPSEDQGWEQIMPTRWR